MKRYKKHISSRFISKNTHILLTNHSKASSSPLTLSHPSAICLHHQLSVFIVCVHLVFVVLFLRLWAMQLLLFPNKVLALSYENFLKKKSRCCPCLTSLMLKGLFITGVIDFPFTFLPCRNETEQSCCCLVGQGFGDRCTQQSKVLQGHSQPQQIM